MAEAQPSANLYVSELPTGMDESSVKQVFSQYGVVESVRVIPAKIPGSLTHALVKFASIDEAQWLCENLNNNIPEGLTDPVKVKFAANSGQFGGAAPGQYKPPMGGGMAMGKGGMGGMGGMGGGCMKGGPAGPWTGGIAASNRSQPYDDGFGGKGGGSQIESLYQALGASGVFPLPSAQNGTYVANLPPDTEELDLLRIFSPFGAIPASNGIKVMRTEDGSCSGIGFVNFTDPEGVQAASATLNGALLPSGTTLIVKPKGAPGPAQPNGMQGMQGMAAPKGFAKGGGGGGRGKGSNPPTPTGEVHQGVLSGYREGSFYCFITCPEVAASYGKDPFCPIAALGGGAFQNGQMVEFDLGVGSDGQPKVMAVRPIGEQADAFAAM